MYNYEILNYWNNLDDLYVDYVVENLDNGNKANVIDYYNTSDIDCDYNTASEDVIKECLLKLVERNNGLEFNMPKVSDLSSLLTYIYNDVRESEANMCHISQDDWLELKEDKGYTEEDIDLLMKEIKQYNLDDYITIDADGYKICGYGCLQCCFNDDRLERVDCLER